MHLPQHVGQHVIRLELQVIRLQLELHVAVAQVVGRTQEVEGRAVRDAVPDHEHRLRGGDHAHERAVLGHEHVAAAHHGAARQEHAEHASLRIGGVEAALLPHVPVELDRGRASEQHPRQASPSGDEFVHCKHLHSMHGCRPQPTLWVGACRWSGRVHKSILVLLERTIPVATAESRRTPPWLWTSIAVAVLAILVIAFSVPWKLNFLRGYIGERVHEATGRELVIEGDIWWHWGRQGRLVAERVRYANPPWAGRPEMLTVDKLQARIALQPLLRKQLQASEVRLSHADLWLEINDIGQRNWYLDRQQSDEGTAPQFGRVFLEAARVRFRQAPRQTEIDVELQSMPGAGQSRLNLRAAGLWNGLKLAAEGQGDDVLQLREVERPYVLNVAATVGNTRIRAGWAGDQPGKPDAPPTSSSNSKARPLASGIASPISAFPTPPIHHGRASCTEARRLAVRGLHQPRRKERPCRHHGFRAPTGAPIHPRQPGLEALRSRGPRPHGRQEAALPRLPHRRPIPNPRSRSRRR